MKKNKTNTFKDVQEEINKELVLEKKEKESFKKSHFYKLFFLFLAKLRSNKLYLLSFIITVLFVGITSLNKVKDSEGFYKVTNSDTTKQDSVTPVVSASDEEDDSKDNLDEDVDVSDYVGIYSREVTMSSSIIIDDDTKIDSYEIIYQVKKDGTMIKYLKSDVLGVIKIWSGSLAISTENDVKYWTSHDTQFLFGTNGTSIKERDGELYSLSKDSGIKENKKLDNVDVYFYNSDIVINTYDNLYLVKGSTISFDLNSLYPNNGGKESQRVFKSTKEYQFNFIVFSSGDESSSCFTDSEDETTNYTTYSITYDSSIEKFKDASVIQTRTKKDGCDILESDLKELSE